MSDYDNEKFGLQDEIEEEVTVSQAPEVIRRQTFSHLSRFPVEFIDKLVHAGFYSCNIDDCVLCLNCHLMVHEWIPESDDPSQIHLSLSPDCKYVQETLRSIDSSTTMTTTTILPGQASNFVPVHMPNETETGDVKYLDDLKRSKMERKKSFISWNHRDSPSIEQFILAGFFYTGHGTRVTCFYCNGSLDEWKSNDDPAIQHVEFFPQCKYIRQYLGEESYQKHLRLKRLRIEPCTIEELYTDESSEKLNASHLTFSRLLCDRNEPSLLSKSVQERLTWSASKDLLDKGYSRSLVEQCWKRQLELKEKDFQSKEQLRIACTILQRYENMENKTNPIVPHVAMKEFRKKQYLLNSGSAIHPEQSTLVGDFSRITDEISMNCLICRSGKREMMCPDCHKLCMCQSCCSSPVTCPSCYLEVTKPLRIYI